MERTDPYRPKERPKYEYESGSCPVLMKEYYYGRLYAEYDAYLDSAGYTWTLHPKKSYGYSPYVPFKFKKISIFECTVLDPPTPPPPQPSAEDIVPFPAETPVEQIPLVKKNYT